MNASQWAHTLLSMVVMGTTTALAFANKVTGTTAVIIAVSVAGISAPALGQLASAAGQMLNLTPAAATIPEPTQPGLSAGANPPAA